MPGKASPTAHLGFPHFPKLPVSGTDRHSLNPLPVSQQCRMTLPQPAACPEIQADIPSTCCLSAVQADIGSTRSCPGSCSSHKHFSVQFNSAEFNLSKVFILIQVIYRLISLMVTILSQYISQNAVINLKCTQFLFVNYIYIKMKEVKKILLQNINLKMRHKERL